jgi:hypothetical protein
MIQDGDYMEDSKVLVIVNNMRDTIWIYMDCKKTFKGIWDSTRNYINYISDM